MEAWLERAKYLKDYRSSYYLMFKDLLEFYAHYFDPMQQYICFNKLQLPIV